MTVWCRSADCRKFCSPVLVGNYFFGKIYCIYNCINRSRTVVVSQRHALKVLTKNVQIDVTVQFFHCHVTAVQNPLCLNMNTVSHIVYTIFKMTITLAKVTRLRCYFVQIPILNCRWWKRSPFFDLHNTDWNPVLKQYWYQIDTREMYYVIRNVKEQKFLCFSVRFVVSDRT